MYIITGRVFNDDKLVGYELSVGVHKDIFDKVTVWKLAKSNQIDNVKAAGTINNPSISGINGFELKKLPDIKIEKQRKFDGGDLYAAGIRHILNTKELPQGMNNKQYKEYCETLLKDDIQRGIFENTNSLSNSILVTNLLYNSKNRITKYKKSIIPNDEEILEKTKEKYKYADIALTLMDEILKMKGTNEIDLDEAINIIRNSNYTSNSRLKWLVDKKLTSEQLQGVIKYLEEIKDDNAGISDLLKNTFNEAMYEVGVNPNRDIIITKRTLDKAHKEYNNIMKKIESFEAKQSLYTTQKIIGYKIKNIGNTPIQITRVTLTIDHTPSTEVLNPNQSIYLNRIETAILAGLPEIGCKFANGVIVTSHLINCDKYNILYWLNKSYFKVKNKINPDTFSLDTAEDLPKLDVANELPEDILEKYFTNSDKIEEATTIRPKSTGIFNLFKK